MAEDTHSVTVERTFDVRLCFNVITHPDIWDSISEDTAKQEDNIPDVIKDIWLAITNNNEVIGCLLYTSPSPRDYAASRMPSSA